MKKISVYILLILSYSVALAESKIDVEQLFKPQKFESIDWYNVDQFETYHSALGKESSLEGNNYYYEVEGIKYPLSLHKKENSEKIEKIYFRIIGKNMKFKQLQSYLQENGFIKEKTPPEKGEFQSYINEKKKIKLNFSAITQNLYSVEKWY